MKTETEINPCVRDLWDLLLKLARDRGVILHANTVDDIRDSVLELAEKWGLPRPKDGWTDGVITVDGYGDNAETGGVCSVKIGDRVVIIDESDPPQTGRVISLPSFDGKITVELDSGSCVAVDPIELRAETSDG